MNFPRCVHERPTSIFKHAEAGLLFRLCSPVDTRTKCLERPFAGDGEFSRHNQRVAGKAPAQPQGAVVHVPLTIGMLDGDGAAHHDAYGGCGAELRLCCNIATGCQGRGQGGNGNSPNETEKTG